MAAQRSSPPSEVYKAMTAGLDTVAPQPEVPMSGYGRMTVRELAEQLRISLDVAVDRLRAAGIAAEPDGNVREIAFANGRLPRISRAS